VEIMYEQESFDYDVAILGGGSAGYAAARTIASQGLRAAVIEGGKEVGGLCILRGCMPTKALLYASEVRHLARHGNHWGMTASTAPFDWQQVVSRKSAMIREFADYRASQLASGKFRFIRTTAQFTDPHTLHLSDGAALTAKNFVITTGSVVSPSPLPQLAQIGYLTSDEALELAKLPRSIIILGGGAIAVEFAQLFARFGVEVSLLQRSPQLLKEFDADAADAIHEALRADGVKLFTGTKLTAARRNGAQKTISFLHEGQGREVSAEEILFALGRTPNTASLGLERAGVHTDNGRILTNESMQSSAPHIYAAGDCTSPHEVVHIAIQQGEIAAHNIANPSRPRQIDYRLLMSIVFTDPQAATVGLTEKAARTQNIPFLAASYPFNDHGKSLIMEARIGFVKLLAHPHTGEILGGANSSTKSSSPCPAA
jgi:pyruvate/2-oxoglutarate dehydrogenase complex dihydrolipoamide dehydrogenase (E3) component